MIILLSICIDDGLKIAFPFLTLSNMFVFFSFQIDIDLEQLVSLRQAQISYRLSDELAEDLFRQHTRKLVEKNISAALDRLKSRTRTVICIALLFGTFEDDLKLLYRAYVTDALSGGRMEEHKLAALNQLNNIFGLGKREAESITLDITSKMICKVLKWIVDDWNQRLKHSNCREMEKVILGSCDLHLEIIQYSIKVYRKRLAQGVSSGDLEFSDSKAAFLQNLCEELHFDPQKATEIHEGTDAPLFPEIYRQKLQQCAADGVLSDEDVKALTRLRVMLFIPQQTIDAAHSDICGSLFEKVVKDAIASGVDGYDADVKKAVRKAAHGLRLTREAARSIAGKAARRIFLNFVKQARMAENRTEGAKALRKLIAFNSLVVTELVADIKGESSDTPPEEPSKVEDKKIEEEDEWDDEEWESLETLKKIRPSEEVAARMGKPGQTEINLKDDLSERERADLYKTYLLYCLTGEVTRIPFEAQITTKDDSEYLLLNQLGGILGLTVKEIVEVHRSLAEQAFRQQAEVILADGQLTKARIEQLNDLQKEVGLPPEYAQKARRIFLNFVKQARMAENRTEGAKALRKLIAFNSLVVTELVADIKGESSDTPPEEPSKVEDKKIEEDDEWDDEEWESLETLKKIRPSEEVAAKMGKPGQTEINLKDDLSERERADLYKTYLLYCLTGEVTRIPFGAQITTKKDDSEYLLLNQLGGILGLTVKEIVEVHRSLAEQAFRQQAEVILADGQLTKARIEQLNELQKQVGLPPEYAQKVIKNITTTKMAAALETAINRGRLNMKQIRELKEASIDFNSMISEKLRENLHKKTVDEIFSSGTGEFDEEEVYEKIPIDLNINAEKAKGVVHELARSRLSNSLIQAVALLRQRNQQGVVSTLNDLLPCDKAVPSEPLTWEYLLGICDSTATALGETKDSVFSVGAEEEKFVF
ncbi:hypothetical protein DKX38_029927 [Salix brachista]|uniref:Protein TIC110, chloroplastic n=1 Tax=Salix brachista TaxID=2182728 RepID=A0A5N5J0G1_9ROSI|nr:hypothetical protein DKX38_029927 [Salix brachista]